METVTRTQPVGHWMKMVELVKANENATDHERRCVEVVEMAIAAAIANLNMGQSHADVTIRNLAANLPAGKLAIDLPVA